ncbi:MAG: helix-turn-helix transcriptional regulator [Lachnospiraceae bacterium]|nr:helix-turn-helix transcriptional regulator [Lachnospiraceae bacterium]MCM1231489.1 helix-turn-helix transcriptional regulator [Ruminococcus flavefaciens]
MKNTDISKSTINKMIHREYVSLNVIDRICNFLSYNVECVVKHIKN